MLMEHSGNKTSNHCATKTKQRFCQWDDEKVKLKVRYINLNPILSKLIWNKLS